MNIVLVKFFLVPQIFFNERHVGGRDDFSALSKEELNDLIKYVRENEPPQIGAPPIPSQSDLLSNSGKQPLFLTFKLKF